MAAVIKARPGRKTENSTLAQTADRLVTSRFLRCNAFLFEMVSVRNYCSVSSHGKGGHEYLVMEALRDRRASHISIVANFGVWRCNEMGRKSILGRPMSSTERSRRRRARIRRERLEAEWDRGYRALLAEADRCYRALLAEAAPLETLLAEAATAEDLLATMVRTP